MMNMFAVLDDSDNEEVPVQKSVTKKEDKSSTKKEVAVASDKDSSSNNKSKSDSTAASKPKDVKQKDYRKENASTSVEVSTKNDGDSEHVKTDSRGGRGRGRGGERRGDGRGRGGRGAPSDADEAERRPRKREFDRHSGTGRSGEQRKDGRGPYSIGNVHQESSQAEKNPESALPEIEAVEDVVAVPETTEEPVEVAAEPLPVSISYEEFVAKRNEARANSEFFGQKTVREVVVDLDNHRVKDETEDADPWAVKTKTVELKKGSQRSNVKTTILDVGFKHESTVVDDDFRGRGRGGGRGDSRGPSRGGRGGRGDVKSERSFRSSGVSSLNINDDSSFPSL